MYLNTLLILILTLPTTISLFLATLIPGRLVNNLSSIAKEVPFTKQSNTADISSVIKRVISYPSWGPRRNEVLCSLSALSRYCPLPESQHLSWTDTDSLSEAFYLNQCGADVPKATLSALPFRHLRDLVSFDGGDGVIMEDVCNLQQGRMIRGKEIYLERRLTGWVVFGGEEVSWKYGNRYSALECQSPSSTMLSIRDLTESGMGVEGGWYDGGLVNH